MPPLTNFLSYRRKDADEVRSFEAALRTRGIRTWRDVNDLHLGGATEEEVLRGIATQSDAFTLYATRHLYDNDSTFIWDKELPAADRRWRADRYPVIALYRGTDPDDLSARCVSLGLSDFGAHANGEWVPLRGEPPDDVQAIRAAHARIARRMLATLLTRRRNHEATIVLRSFPQPDLPAETLLDMDWTAALEASAPRWEELLFPALRDVAAELETASFHDLTLYPHARLSICVAFGIAFPLTTRLHIRLMGRDREWPQLVGVAPITMTHAEEAAGDARRAVVALGFTRDLSVAAMEIRRLTGARHTRAVEPTDVGLDNHTRAIAELVGRELRRLSDAGVREFHLLLASPAPLAVAIGRQLHALGDIVFYYADPERRPAIAFRVSV